ncbi:colipase-like 2 [Cricetulus griseus]
MAQWVKVLAAKLEDPSSILSIQRQEESSDCGKLSSDLTYAMAETGQGLSLEAMVLIPHPLSRTFCDHRAHTGWLPLPQGFISSTVQEPSATQAMAFTRALATMLALLTGVQPHVFSETSEYKKTGAGDQGLSPQANGDRCVHHNQCFSDCCLIDLERRGAFCTSKSRMGMECLPQGSLKQAVVNWKTQRCRMACSYSLALGPNSSRDQGDPELRMSLPNRLELPFQGTHVPPPLPNDLEEDTGCSWQLRLHPPPGVPLLRCPYPTPPPSKLVPIKVTSWLRSLSALCGKAPRWGPGFMGGAGLRDEAGGVGGNVL